MTSPIVTECSKAPLPVDRDTFIDTVDEARPAPQPKPRP
jgi:hypothetical protein